MSDAPQRFKTLETPFVSLYAHESQYDNGGYIFCQYLMSHAHESYVGRVGLVKRKTGYLCVSKSGACPVGIIYSIKDNRHAWVLRLSNNERVHVRTYEVANARWINSPVWISTKSGSVSKGWYTGNSPPRSDDVLLGICDGLSAKHYGCIIVRCMIGFDPVCV